MAGLKPPKGLPLTIWLMRCCGLRISEALAVRDTSLSGEILRISEPSAWARATEALDAEYETWSVA
jgi:hypothetical protein